MILDCVSCTFALHIRRLYHCINWRNIHLQRTLAQYSFYIQRVYQSNKLTNERCQNRGMARLTLYVFFGINTKNTTGKNTIYFIEKGSIICLPFHDNTFFGLFQLFFVWLRSSMMLIDVSSRPGPDLRWGGGGVSSEISGIHSNIPIL